MSSVAEQAPPVESVAGTRRSRAGLLQGVAIGLGFVMMTGGFGVIAAEYRPYQIPTNSMSPTVNPGDTVLARSVAGSSAGRGDIVIFRDQFWGGETMVKRVIGVGGDTVAFDDTQRKLTVNGAPIEEPYLSSAGWGSVSLGFSVHVPEGRLFVLGDDRAVSLDSRSHLDVAAGSIPATEVTARVEGTVWPFDRVSVQRRTVAFDGLGGPVASRPGLLEPAAYAMLGGAGLILLASAVGGVVSLGRRLARRRAA
ncbi:signal peptidase I [Kitasatospora sp. McL0602]|uniref:signal peptidase I n=1 Tax=Kitasatospora sp. McL0602 TaxID=3439530 RepID=UPI003F8CDC6B